MDLPKALIGAGAGAAAALVLWAGIAYALGMDLAFFAILVGIVCGAGVWVATKGRQDPGHGLVAAVVTVVAIILGFFITTMLVTERLKAKATAEAKQVVFTDDHMLVEEAKKIASTRVRLGQKIAWPAGMTLMDVKTISDFPADIAQQATANWNAQTNKEGIKAEAKNYLEQVKFGSVKSQRETAFGDSFGMMGILMILLGAGAAFGAGFGTKKGDGEDDAFSDDGTGVIRASDA
jgi:hypothetical protein